MASQPGGKQKASVGVWVLLALAAVLAFLLWKPSVTLPQAGESATVPVQGGSGEALMEVLRQTGRKKTPEKWTGGPAGSSAMDDSQTVTYELEAQNVLDGWLSHRIPSLIVRCQEHKTEVYIQTGFPLTSELGRFRRHTIRLRFDDRPAGKELWSESTDNEAIFAPSSVALARRIAKTKRLRVELTPFNSSPQTIEFAVEGFQDSAKELGKACGWKL